MLDAKDARLIHALRQGSRAKLKTIAERSGIPLSTAHERLHKLTGRGDARPVPLLDYPRLGVPLTTWLAISTKRRDETKQWLRNNPHVNTLIEVSNGADLLCEGVFATFAQQHAFLEEIKQYGKTKAHPVIHEVARENAKIKRKEKP